MTAPLHLRLPNPPVPFVGRARESSALRSAIDRAPVSVVAGACGIGKSALSAEVLAAEREGVRVVRVEGGSWESLWAALGEPGRTDGDLAALVDLADARDARLLLEDAHRAEPAELRRLLAAAMLYARRSRWIVASRAAIDDVNLAAQHVHLGGIDDESLSTLASAYAPSLAPDRIREVVLAARGSPWHVQRALGLRPDPRELVGPLPAPDLAFLDLMRRVEVPLAPLTLRKTFGIEDESLDLWIRSSIVERIDGGVRVREAVRESLVIADGPSCCQENWARAGLETLAAVLEETADESALVVAVRIHALLEATAAIRRLFDASGDALLEAGFAPELWREIAGRREPELAAWRLRIGADVGASAYDVLSYPPDAEARDDLLWARVRATQGDAAGAIAAASRALESAEAHGDALAVARAARTLARVLARHGRADEAMALLERTRPREPAAALEHDSVYAIALIAARRDDEVAEMIDDLRARLDALGGASIELRGTIAWLAGNTGRLEIAWPVIRDAVARLGPRAERRDVGRRTLLAAFQIAIDCGELRAAAALRDRLATVAVEHSYVGECVRLAIARLGLARGELDGLEAMLSAPSDEWRVERFRRPIELRIAMLKGVPHEPARELPGDARIVVVRLVEAEHAVRFGWVADRAVLEHAACENDFEAEALALRLRAELLLAAGSTRAALEWAWKAVTRARNARWAIMEAEARCVAADALAIAGERSELDVAARELAALADRIGSRRFACDARFYTWLAKAERSRGALLALDTTAASIGARRARALLGGAPLDAIDELVLATCGPTRVRAITESRTLAERWLIDARAGDVWLTSGKLELSAESVGARILRALVADGGHTSKEALVLAVWEPREYHPLKHDNRLKLAVRKLRTQIEDDASRPARIVTTDDGYALGPGALAEEEVPEHAASFGRLREAFQA